MPARPTAVCRPMMEPRRSRWIIHKQGPLLGLIGLMFVIFLCQEIGGRAWYRDWMAVPGAIVQSWHKVLAGSAGGADYRELGTLLSCAFLHGGVEHVLYNMLYLWIFAALAADLLGQRWMLLIFVVTALCGSICHTLLNARECIPMLGASGAVMGFEGAYLGLATRWRLPEPQVWPMTRPISPGQLAALAVFGVAMDYLSLMGHAGGGVAYGAHIGGFTAGLFLTATLAPRPAAARDH
jgi:membrane associated rhomboid family serine protease